MCQALSGPRARMVMVVGFIRLTDSPLGMNRHLDQCKITAVTGAMPWQLRLGDNGKEINGNVPGDGTFCPVTCRMSPEVGGWGKSKSPTGRGPWPEAGPVAEGSWGIQDP